MLQTFADYEPTTQPQPTTWQQKFSQYLQYVSVCGPSISTHIPLPLFTPIKVHANTVHTTNFW